MKNPISFRGFVLIACGVALLAFWSCVANAAPQEDRQALQMLNRINRAANIEIPQGTLWNDGRDGIWNCEEVAGLKLGRLIDAGYPHKVRSYQVTTSWGEEHAVLEVTLPSGRPVILDSLSPWILTRAQTGHTDWRPAYIRRQ